MSRISLVFVAVAVIATSCGAQDATAEFCEGAGGDVVASTLGQVELQTFSIERLDECVWTSVDDPDESVTVRIEDVPDGALFVEHAIEATPDDDRVQRLDFGEDSVMFVDEAVLGRVGDRIALVTGTVSTEELLPLLEQTLTVMDS